MSEYRKCWFGFFQKSPASFVRLRQRVVPPRGGGVRHCCRCSLLIIGSICPLSQLGLSRGLLQPIKCALSAPSTPAARIIRPNYSSYPRALFTGMGWLIGGAWVASARILRQSNSAPMSPHFPPFRDILSFGEELNNMCKYTNIICFEFYLSILRFPSYIIVGPEPIPHMIQDNSGHFLAWWCNTH